MGFTHQGGGDTSRGGRVDKPCWAHCVIERIEEPVLDRNNAIVSNSAFAANLKVADGTDKTQIDRTHRVMFFHPKPGEDSKDMDMFFIATGAMTPQQVRDKVRVDIELTPNPKNPTVRPIEGRQIVVQFVPDMSEKNAGKGYLKTWSNFYHVDDPAVSHIAKDQALMGLIPADLRLINKPAEYFTGKEAAPRTAAAAATERDL